jgi:hypothetical protein
MQIHELNRRPQQVNEIFGPTGLVATAKQVVKNPASLFRSSALGAAQQAAAQDSAAQSAQKLAAQGYQAGGSIKPQVTLAQQLATVKSNPAVQQQVKNLTAQWQKQGAAIVASLKNKKPIPEAVVIGNPELTKDPAERKLLDLFYKQQAQKDQAAGQQTAPTPDQQDKAEVNQQLEELGLAFAKWADPRLATGGVTMDTVRQDTGVNKILSDQLTKIAIETMANPASVATTAAISEYFNTAIAAIQATINNSQPRTTRTRTAAPATAAPAAGKAPTEAELLTQLQQQGVSMTRAELESLGQALTAANGGSNVIRDTGNELLNAMARLAGMRVGS